MISKNKAVNRLEEVLERTSQCCLSSFFNKMVSALYKAWEPPEVVVYRLTSIVYADVLGR